jgi:hypothetical protein
MMKRFVSFLVAVLAVAAMLGAFPALVVADQGVPFKGSAELTVAMDGSLVGTGEGTQIGRFSEVAYPVINGNTFSATVILTAANGDQVFKMATGTITSNGTTTTFAGPFTVLGGTGRFVNATGSGQVEMVLSPDGTIAQIYDGTIQF